MKFWVTNFIVIFGRIIQYICLPLVFHTLYLTQVEKYAIYGYICDTKSIIVNAILNSVSANLYGMYVELAANNF
jgi:hypothetical protein